MSNAPDPGLAGVGHLPPPPRIPGYRDLVLHRQGSSAEVYRATMDRLGRTVAVKVLRPDGTTTYEQFQQELQTAMRLSMQPYVVRILDTGTVEGRPYLAMEFCEDGSYAEIVPRYGPLSIQDTVDVGTKIAEALHEAHQQGFIHRDVTPGNVLRSRFGPSLADFGIARKPAELTGTVTLNKLTPHHAAPEALRRESQSPASDIYSLASTLWYLLAGYPPFAQHGETNPDPFTYRERALQRPAPLVPRPDVPVWLQTEIAKALLKRPEDRHPTAEAFGEALQRGWEHAHGTPWRPPASYPPLGGGAYSGEQATGTPDAPTETASAWPPAPAATPWPSPTSEPPAEHAAWMRPTSGGQPFSAAPPGAPMSPAASSVSTSPGSAVPGVTPTSPAFTSAPPGPPSSFSTGPPARSAPRPYDPDEKVGFTAAPPVPAGRHRQKGGGFLVAGVVGVVLGLLILLTTALLPTTNAQQPTPTQPPETPPDTATASIAADKAPTGVRIDDRGASVVLSWQDHTANTAPHYVIGGPERASPRPMTQVEKGITKVKIDGLNPNTNYCFTVIAVVSVDEVAPAEKVCTQRR